MKCEGQRRYGGVFTLGPVTWVDCPDTPTVLLKIGGKVLPACNTCWQECIDNKMVIEEVIPIQKKEEN
jgi:hypothetical protein